MRNLQKKIEKFFDYLALTNSPSKFFTSLSLNYIQNDSELLDKLQKFYKRPNTVKISKKLANEKMLHKLEFYQTQLSADVYDEEWNRTLADYLDIDAPYKISAIFENLNL